MVRTLSDVERRESKSWIAARLNRTWNFKRSKRTEICSRKREQFVPVFRNIRIIADSMPMAENISGKIPKGSVHVYSWSCSTFFRFSSPYSRIFLFFFFLRKRRSLFFFFPPSMLLFPCFPWSDSFCFRVVQNEGRRKNWILKFDTATNFIVPRESRELI